MMQRAAAILLLAGTASGFSQLGLGRATISGPRSAVAMSAAPRVVNDPLPRVYVYDHCPFCVRVRVALGFKNVKHDVVFLANDDIPTPTALVGKKIAPILELRDEGLVMGESLDIIDVFDKDEKWGQVGAILPATGRKDLKEWQKTVKEEMRILQRPRYVKSFLPEFAMRDARDAFVKNHPVPPYEKPEWKADDFSQATRVAKYEECLANTGPALASVNAALKKLEPLIHCPNCCTEGGFSIDDIDLFSRLRSLTIVKGVEFPAGVRSYLDNLSEVCDVPLYDCMAL